MSQSERDDNRTRFPETAALVDQFRAAGIPVKVVYASEGGHIVGSRARHDEWDRAVPVPNMDDVAVSEALDRLYQRPRRRRGR